MSPVVSSRPSVAWFCLSNPISCSSADLSGVSVAIVVTS
jgi:hypothetical protein